MPIACAPTARTRRGSSASSARPISSRITGARPASLVARSTPRSRPPTQRARSSRGDSPPSGTAARWSVPAALRPHPRTDDVLSAAYRVIASFLSTPYPIESFEYVLRGISRAERAGDRAAEAMGMAMLAAYLATGSLGRFGDRAIASAPRPPQPPHCAWGRKPTSASARTPTRRCRAALSSRANAAASSTVSRARHSPATASMRVRYARRAPGVLEESLANPTVIVIGGGVGGLTAAHELVERGFTVHVYESRASWGGKARSQPVTGSGTSGRLDLPGEHGFRFYPRFYKHVIDTMARIPNATGGHVIDHLRSPTESAIALIGNDSWYRFYRKAVTKPFDILEALELFFQELDFDTEDIGLFSAKILQFLTSSNARRLGEYDKISRWDFLDGDRYSPKFQRQLRAVPRTMVAMDPKRGSARTVGTISMQLILDYAGTGVNNDRTMGGPTSEMWFDPWIAHLATLGVNMHSGVSIASLEVAGGQISGVRLADGTLVTGDFYVLATPIDTTIGLLTPQIGARDPVLEKLRTSSVDTLVSWMSGIQYYLYEDVPLVRGHTNSPASPRAQPSNSQPQFWRDLGLFRKRYGGGEVGGLLSIAVSDWNTPGTFIPKIAKACTPAEIAKEIWEQLKAALTGKGPNAQILTEALLHSWHHDEDLDFTAGVPPVNRSRLLVPPPGAWDLRPDAGPAIPT